MLATMAEKSRVNTMFGWFQRLLPKTGNFFEMFEAHAVTIDAAAEAPARLISGEARPRRAYP